MPFFNIFYLLLSLRSILINVYIVKIIKIFSNSLIVNETLHTEKHLIFILKVYKETEVIEQSISFIQSMISNHENVSVIVSGNHKERNKFNENPTLETVKKIVSRDKRFQIVECDHPNATHAHQNNYALNFISTSPENTWIYLLDVDSRFSKESLNEIFSYINSDRKIIVQHSLFLDNFYQLDWIQKGNALYQSRWTIAHEMRRISLSNWLGCYYYNVIGHGTCIQLKKLLDYDKFPEDVPIEDSALGYSLSSKGERVYSIRYFENGDTPPRSMPGYNQQKTWAMGPMFIPIYYKNYLKSNKKVFDVKAFTIAVIGFSSFIAWFSSSFIIIFAIYNSYHLNFFCIFYLFLYILEFQQTASFFCKMGLISNTSKNLAAAYILPELLRRSFPVLHSVLDVLFFKKIYKFKTEHY